MAVNPNRPWFIETIKQRTLTIKEIREMFNVSENTARMWVRLPNIEKIPDHSPPTYRYVGTDLAPVAVTVETEAISHANCLRGMPQATDAQKQEMLDSFIDDETQFDVGAKFRSVESVEDIDKMVIGLKSIIVTALYYRDNIK